MITFSWPSPSLIGLQRLWLTLWIEFSLLTNTDTRTSTQTKTSTENERITVRLGRHLSTKLPQVDLHSTHPVVLPHLVMVKQGNVDEVIKLLIPASSRLLQPNVCFWYSPVEVHTLPPFWIQGVIDSLASVLFLTQGHLEVALKMVLHDKKYKWLLGYKSKNGQCGHLAIRIATCSAIHGKNAPCLRQNVMLDSQSSGFNFENFSFTCTNRTWTTPVTLRFFPAFPSFCDRNI